MNIELSNENTLVVTKKPKYYITMTTKILNQFNSFLGQDYKIFKLIFTIVASCLIIDLFYTFLVLRPTYTSNEKRKMSAEDFPEIIICPLPSVNLDAIESNGYGDQERYFFGIDDIEKGTNQIGWAGNNKSDNVSMVYEEISVLNSVNDCPAGLESWMWFNGKTKKEIAVEFIQFNLTKMLNPYHRCCKVYPSSEYVHSYPLIQIQFKWSAPSQEGFEVMKVFLADQLTASFFDLHKTIMLGSDIVSSNVAGSGEIKKGIGLIDYKVKIMEEQKLANDPNYPCTDYKINGEYSKCLEDEMVRQNLEFLNCTPPWMTDNENLHCSGRLDLKTASNAYNYIRFLNDLSLSEGNPGRCSVPCKTKKYQAKAIGLKGNKNNMTGITITFERDVDITRSSWKIDSKSLISKIGGFIGICKNFLWLIILFISSAGVIISHLNLNVVE